MNDNEDKTIIVRRGGFARPQPERQQDKTSAFDPDATEKVSRPGGSSPRDSDSSVTILAGRGRSGSVEGMADPVTGWLVIVDGPGKGNFVKIGNGKNRLGRERQGNELCLEWGDSEVSREAHAVIKYDAKARRFKILDGAGRNLTHVNGEDLDDARVLESGDRITVGGTTLVFVPFCGPSFDWSDEKVPPAP